MPNHRDHSQEVQLKLPCTTAVEMKKGVGPLSTGAGFGCKLQRQRPKWSRCEKASQASSFCLKNFHHHRKQVQPTTAQPICTFPRAHPNDTLRARAAVTSIDCSKGRSVFEVNRSNVSLRSRRDAGRVRSLSSSPRVSIFASRQRTRA